MSADMNTLGLLPVYRSNGLEMMPARRTKHGWSGPSHNYNAATVADSALRYRQLHQRLVELDEQRQKQQQKLAQYKQLKSLLEPFSDPQTNIQPNLVTRDSQLGEELDRMRMLVAKVAGRIEEAGKSGFAMEEQPASSVDHDAKLSALLDMT